MSDDKEITEAFEEAESEMFSITCDDGLSIEAAKYVLVYMANELKLRKRRNWLHGVALKSINDQCLEINTDHSMDEIGATGMYACDRVYSDLSRADDTGGPDL